MTDAVYVGCLAVSPQSSVRNKEPWIGRWWIRRHVVSLPAQSTDFESRVPESCLHTGVARLGGGGINHGQSKRLISPLADSGECRLSFLNPNTGVLSGSRPRRLCSRQQFRRLCSDNMHTCIYVCTVCTYHIAHCGLTRIETAFWIDFGPRCPAFRGVFGDKLAHLLAHFGVQTDSLSC